MKTPEEILDSLSVRRGADTFPEFIKNGFIGSIENLVKEAMKEYAIEIAKQTQQNIADATDNDSIGKYIKMLALDESKIPSLDN